MNNGANCTADLAIIPGIDLSELSESKKSYLLIPSLSIVNKSVLDTTYLLAKDLPFNVSV
ncbi:hypothetical protein [uncultured Leptotrichia sp.]|jgi:hypothetical protein|uniref:hypothetical protein n=1 Tax=uncultured Leptotrichia sp. TaxID=159271 RepID=UPI0025CBDA5B|nr:hypothetical protein [uncultured Leptotrichia sp.]